MSSKTSKILTNATCIAAVMMLSACGLSDRLDHVGKPPELAQIENPYEQQGYRPVTMPMPPVVAQNNEMNSLWQSGRSTFFKDQRANKVGDILTIMIDIRDVANMKNKTERTRNSADNVGVPNALGLEKTIGKIMPDAFDPASALSANSASTSTGDGKIERQEQINLKLAATVVQVLPNGNFVIQGRQQVRVNAELRDLALQGVIRPEDILNNNSISYEKIAEARIVYGGKGSLADIQTPRYGQQFFDAVMPF